MRAPTDDHLADPKGQMKFMASVLGVGTVFAIAVKLLVGSWLLLIGVGLGWAVLGGYYVVLTRLLEPVADAIGRVLVPSGSSTPPAKGLSHIEAMVARGQLADAAAAYQTEIATDPEDIASCERLGQLALRELKDYDLAILAYREAEKRAQAPNKKFGYGLIVAGIYRDQLKDPGKTVVELSRLLSRYPDAPNTASVRSELEELKASLFQGS